MKLPDDSILSAYIDDELPVTERSALENLIQSDPELARRVEEFRWLRGLVAGLERPTAARDTAESVIEAIGSTQAAAVELSHEPPGPHLFRRPVRVLGFGVLLTAAAALWLAFLGRPPMPGEFEQANDGNRPVHDLTQEHLPSLVHTPQETPDNKSDLVAGNLDTVTPSPRVGPEERATDVASSPVFDEAAEAVASSGLALPEPVGPVDPNVLAFLDALDPLDQSRSVMLTLDPPRPIKVGEIDQVLRDSPRREPFYIQLPVEFVDAKGSDIPLPPDVVFVFRANEREMDVFLKRLHEVVQRPLRVADFNQDSAFSRELSSITASAVRRGTNRAALLETATEIQARRENDTVEQPVFIGPHAPNRTPKRALPAETATPPSDASSDPSESTNLGSAPSATQTIWLWVRTANSESE